jgi:cytochrome P450
MSSAVRLGNLNADLMILNRCPLNEAVAETTIAGVLTFILAMLLHPEVQCKAQQEIDGAVGFDRLPDFSDQLQLPYLSAIVKEVLRSATYLSISRNLH